MNDVIIRFLADKKLFSKGVKGIPKEVSDQMDKVDDEVSQTTNKMPNYFKKAGLAIGAVFSIGKILNFGKMAIESSAGTQALEAQFSTVFGKMESTADKTLNSIAKKNGMLPNRLKGSFTQIASFAKVSGSSTEDALALSSRAMIAASDSAAFYDRSVEDVTDSLKSFLKGNYENDDALGISATETTRNEMANKKYSKSFNELSESQKQDTLLAMVEAGNKAGGALGQASREADSYENQMGNLNQSWEDFKSIVGGPFLSIVVSGIKQVTKAIQSIPKAQVQAFLGGIADKISSFDFSIITNAITEVFNVIKGVIGFIQKNWGIISNILIVVGSIVGVLKLVTTGMTLVTGAIKLWTGAQTLLNIAMSMNPITIVALAVGVLVGVLIVAYRESETFRNIVNTAFNKIKEVAGVVFNFLKVFIPKAVGIFVAVVKGKIDFLLAIWKITFNLVKTVIVAVFNFIKVTIPKTVENIKNSIINKVRQIQANWKALWNNIKMHVLVVFNGVKNTVSGGINFVKNTISNVINTIKRIWSNGWNAVKNTVTSIITKITNTFKNFSLFEIGKNIIQGLINGIANMIGSVGRIVSDVASSVADGFKSFFGIHSPSRLMNKEIGHHLMTGLVQGITGMKSTVLKTVTDMNDLIYGGFNNESSFAYDLSGSGAGLIDVGYEDIDKKFEANKGITINNNVDVELDGEKVYKSVKTREERDDRRSKF